MSFLMRLASSRVWICRTLPSVRRTIGPSTRSHVLMLEAFPGRSVLSWVPVAMYWLRMYMVAGWMLWELKPLMRDLPYLSRKPPARRG